VETCIQYTISGLATGSLYSLVALGLVLIYRATRILNFAHGELATIGTFFALTLLSMGVPLAATIPLSLLFGSALAVIFYFCILIPAQRRDATPLGQIILTLGFGMIFQGIVMYVWGPEPQSFPSLLSETTTYQLSGIILNQLDIGTLAIALAVSALFYLLIQKTRLGTAMRATQENLTAAQTLGIPTRGILCLTWALAAFIGVFAGLFLAPKLLLDPFFMLEAFLKGFAAAILGGLNSLPGAVAGGLILGVSESLVGCYVSMQFKNVMAFIVIILVLLVRPEGLLGKEFKERI